MSHLIAPSLLSADFANLKADIDMINKSHADWFHVDVMDGVFVPNISFGFPVIKQIKKYATKPLDIHLMIINPDKYIKSFKDVGANIITVHYETCTHLHRTIHAIKDMGIKSGVVLNPHTNINVLENIITDVDLILVMSVNPGFGGQKFIENTYSKVKKLKQLIIDRNSSALIEVDGGVNIENALKLIKAGTDVLVAGNFIFSSDNPIQTIADLKNLA